MGGEKADFNCVKLTYREHYVAHKLLSKIFPDNRSIQYALLCMLRDPHNNRKLTSRQIESIKYDYVRFKKKDMKVNNPMFTDRAKKLHSDRMKANNPITKEPWKNHTANPVRVHYINGLIREFTYMKEVSILTGVPYGTLKYASRKGIGSKKWGIKKIEKIMGVIDC